MKIYKEEAYDVVVVGGGFSGVAAAVAAAREGASVLLADKNGSLGGSATGCNVNPFMKYYYYKADTAETEQNRCYICNGIFKEILEGMTELGGYNESDKYFNPEVLKITMDKLCEKYGVKVLYHAYLFDSELDGRTVKTACFATSAGVYKASAKIFIDASGDANLAFLSGCEYGLGRDEDGFCQPITTNFILSNLDFESGGGFSEIKKAINKAYCDAKAEGKLINPRENVLCFKSYEKNSMRYNMTRIVKKNPVDPFDVSEAEVTARKQILEFVELIREKVPGCENAIISLSGPDIGIRESRRVYGDYVINATDILSCTPFPDSIACGSYYIDIHNPSGTGTHIEYVEKGKYYKIPYRALIAKDTDNLLVVGRCISSTHEAQSAYRIMPIVCCIGEGGGAAAGYAVKTGKSVRSVDIAAVREKLKNEYNATID